MPVPDGIGSRCAAELASDGISSGVQRYYDASHTRFGRATQADPANDHDIYFGDMRDIRSMASDPDRVGDIIDDKILGRWDYVKNQAFWAGGIVAGRTFRLVQALPESMLSEKMSKHFVDAVTGDELLWLRDNGYEFLFEGTDLTILVARPTAETTNFVRDGQVTMIIAIKS